MEENSDNSTNSQYINVFSDYDYDIETNDSEKIVGKGRLFEPNMNSLKKESDHDEKNDADSCRDLAKSGIAEAENSEAFEENSVWSIEDTLFYPFGICNHSSADAKKSVIIIWSEYSVIMHVIKKMINKKQTRTKKVRHNLHYDGKIKDVQILDFNTLVLLESGHIKYFSSVKLMHSLPWLESVRCIGRTLHGFCIIRLTHDQRLLLEVYMDAVNMGEQTAGSVNQQYDITFDEENIFNCSWEDDNFVIFAIAIEAENIEFIQHLIPHPCDLKDQNEIFIFAVSGNVFVLIPDAANNEMYHIEKIFSYASNVGLIKIDQQRSFCLIFLECGIVDIWYMSAIAKRLLHQVHNTGAEYVNFTYSDSRPSFFFTDESQVVELRFLYDPLSDKFTVKETFKAIPGILACTWVESVEQLICLDCNNIFHQLSFEAINSTDIKEDNALKIDEFTPFTSVADFEKFNTLYELTPSRVTQLIRNASTIQQLKNLPRELYEAIENEYVKQHLLAIYDKRNYYCGQLSACLRFSKYLTSDFEANTVFLYANTYDLSGNAGNNLFAHISFQITCKDVFRNSIWQLHVHFDNTLHVFSLPYCLMESKIHLVVPLKRRPQQLLSSIELYLYTFISHTTDHVAISLPIRLIETAETYVDLFALKCSHFEKISSAYNLDDLFLRFKSSVAKTGSQEFQHFLSLPKNINFDTIIRLFKLMPEDQVAVDLEECSIVFLNENIFMSWDESKRILNVKSSDAGAMYYFKLYLLLAYNEKQFPDALFQFKEYEQMILRLQSSVENNYGILPDSHNNDSISTSLMNQRFQNLKDIYVRMRTCKNM